MRDAKYVCGDCGTIVSNLGRHITRNRCERILSYRKNRRLEQHKKMVKRNDNKR